MIAVGLLWSATLSGLYFVLVLAGAVFNVLIYTLWLKRRTAWSILFGGIAGSMPILAGRALAMGKIDLPGIVLGLIVLSWIPSHNLTLTSLYADDYKLAGVPTFPNIYGTSATGILISLSCLITAALVVLAFAWLKPLLLLMVLVAAAGVVLVGFAIYAWLHRKPGILMLQYKYSSIYMLVCMLFLALSFNVGVF
jgi:protoheme IX farnesyltransferase